MDKKDAIILTILFLTAFWLWTMPIREYGMPFSESDGTHHFSVSDYWSGENQVIEKYPFYLSNYVGKITQPDGSMIYAPPYFINIALAKRITLERITGFFFFVAILDFAIIFSVYFLVQKLYNTYAAALAGLLLTFSRLDTTTHIMGQYTILLSLAVIPLIIYCYHRYITSYLGGEEKPQYLYIMAGLLVVQFISHYQPIIHTALFLVLYSVYKMGSAKKFLIFNYKHAIGSLVLLVIILSPFILRPLEYSGKGDPDSRPLDFPKFKYLFDWVSDKVRGNAFPQGFFSYTYNHGRWSIPFLLLGVLVLLLRRNESDKVILLWALTLYLILHSDILIGFSHARIPRAFVEIPHIIYPIMAIGVMAIPALIGLKAEQKQNTILGLSIVFAALILLMAAMPLIDTMKMAYGGLSRINPLQYQAAEWMRTNLPDKTIAVLYGEPIQQIAIWWKTISQRYVFYDRSLSVEHVNFKNDPFTITHLIIDYTFAKFTKNQELATQLIEFEKSTVGNLTPIYNENDIRIYQVNINGTQQ